MTATPAAMARFGRREMPADAVDRRRPPAGWCYARRALSAAWICPRRFRPSGRGLRPCARRTTRVEREHAGKAHGEFERQREGSRRGYCGLRHGKQPLLRQTWSRAPPPSGDALEQSLRCPVPSARPASSAHHQLAGGLRVGGGCLPPLIQSTRFCVLSLPCSVELTAIVP